LLCSSFLFVQLLLLKSTDSADIEWSKEVKGSMYDVIVEGFQLLSRWTARIWEQCAWKFSRPCKDPVPLESHETSASFSDYEKVLCPLCVFLFFFRLIFNKSFLSPFHICLILSLTAVTNQYLSTCSDLFVYHLYLNCLLFFSSIWSLFYFFSPFCILCAHRAFFLLIKFHLTYKKKKKKIVCYSFLLLLLHLRFPWFLVYLFSYWVTTKLNLNGDNAAYRLTQDGSSNGPWYQFWCRIFRNSALN
jgi:hypothetical protein